MRSLLLGCPVAHSTSPYVCEEIARQLNITYIHEKYEVKKVEELDMYIDKLRTSEICGINITMPYKKVVTSKVDLLDISAVNSGAVNTLVRRNDKIIGYNTDGMAAIMAMKRAGFSLSNKTNVLIIGSGGVAVALIAVLKDIVKKITVFCRNEEERKYIFDHFGIDVSVIFKSSYQDYINFVGCNDLVINATPVGMYPDSKSSIIPEKIFIDASVRGKQFFDVILNPYKTLFLSLAEKYGGKICSGMDMMIYQMLLAFHLWTGLNVDNIDAIRISQKLKALEVE